MSAWRTYAVKPDHAYRAWARCLWCGERGHFREDCARQHSHGAVARNGNCLGCGEAVVREWANTGGTQND